jgi:4-hydroxybutyrate CoA-transferase
MGGYVAERIPNGATIQLGAGAAPDMVGRFLENHRDLGVHTEMFVEAMAHLMKKGVINNSQKTLLRGVSVASFLGGGPVTREFAHKNRDILLKKISWVNDPAVISQIQDIISVNSCLGVDLRGQVCSESIGLSSSGGIGGQLDFVRGARRAKGGKSFIVMRSVLEKKDGTRLPKITLTLPKGSVVSTPRSDVMYVATEYGVAELQYRSVKERAHALISISHPDFREELTFEAKKHGLI